MKVDCKASFEELENEKAMFAQGKKEFEACKSELLERESELTASKEALTRLQQQVDKKIELQSEREKDMEGKIKLLKDRERIVKAEEKRLDGEKKKFEEDKEKAKMLQQEIQDLKASIELQRQQVIAEEEKLRLTEQDREDFIKLQRCLKEEIDDFRAQAKAVELEKEELKKEKDRFEKQWEILDEKHEEVKRELERADEEAHRVAKWLHEEEARLKEEKRILQEQIQKESEALRLEKEEFIRTVERERAEWFASVEEERETLIKDLDAKKREMEKNIERHIAETKKERKEQELKFKREAEQEKEKMESLKSLAEAKLEEVRLEQHKLEKERQEIAKLREECGREWLEIKKDVDELQMQREKLRDQREALIRERDETVQEAEKLRKLKGEQGETVGNSQVPFSSELAVTTPKTRSWMSAFKKERSGMDAISLASPSFGRGTPEKSASDTPSRLSWFRKCVVGLFPSPEGRPDYFIFKGSQKGDVNTPPKMLPPMDCEPEAAENVSVEEQHESSSTSKTSGSSSEQINEGLQSRRKGKGKHPMRTRSIRAVVEDAKAILQSVSAEKEGGEVEPLDVVAMNTFMPENEAITQATDEYEADTPSRQGRKRQRSAIENVNGMDADNMEAGTEVLTIGAKRKRHQGISEIVLDSVPKREPPVVKRYNFRRSTITKLGAPKSSESLPALDSPKDVSSIGKVGIEVVLQEQVDMVFQKNHGDVSDVEINGKYVVSDAGDINVENREDIAQGDEELITRGKEAEVVRDEDHGVHETEPVSNVDENLRLEYSEESDDGVVEEDSQFSDSNAGLNNRGDENELSEESEDDIDENCTQKQKWWDFLTT
ncbi:hypothetical protein KP509_07G023500 [Ceratopteris richardii]|nr:hypothetical protein KP509_07G023500 [Ceratopteris richardii]